jgi:predicted small secreted protein
MGSRKRFGAASLFLAVVTLIGVGSLLSACDTVAGAGQDISWFMRSPATPSRRSEELLRPGINRHPPVAGVSCNRMCFGALSVRQSGSCGEIGSPMHSSSA